MPDTIAPAPDGIALLLSLVPVLYAVGALRGIGADPYATAGLWRTARIVAGTAVALAGLAAALLVRQGEGIGTLGTLAELGPLGSLSLSVRFDVLTVVMLALVSFIGFVILQFSRRYLDGDPGQPRYVRWYLGTLAAVSLLIVTNDLLVMLLGWIGTSLALHQLLTFYADRPQALIAAHKKFIASRVADAAMLGAVVLIGLEFNTLELDEIFAALAVGGPLSGELQVAAVLLVAAAALKCAQLPFHGWLIQVMEAPTPVSALLHAGVVNIGGFLMIRMAPLMVQAELAQTLLVVCGSVTAVIAALVMTTRVSIKVALAWSTCAQMGFMLLEAGLGAYSLALLHLVAHSFYKAHAFLSSGSVVETWRAQAIRVRKQPASLAAWFAAAAVSLAGVAAVAALAGVSTREEPALWALVTIVALALTPLGVRSTAGGLARFAVLGGASIAVAALYFAWHGAFAGLLAGPAAAAATPWRLGIVLAAFAVLFVLYALISARPTGALAQALFPRLFAGLYLDELFTRLTFRVWPAQLPDTTPASVPGRPLSQEA